MSGETDSAKNYLSLQKQVSCELNKLIACGILYEEEAGNIANDILFDIIDNHRDCICSSLEIDSIIVKFITTKGPYSGLDPKYFDVIRERLSKKLDSPFIESCDTTCWKNNTESKGSESIWLF